MAEVGGMLASAVLRLVLQKIGAIIGGRITLQQDFTKDLENMKMTLETLGAVLEDAERQSIQEKATQLWLKRLKDAMYGISDMLDEFEADTQPAEPKVFPKKSPRRTSWIVFGPKSKLINRMKEMRKELKEITDQHKSFMLKSDTTANVLKFVDTRETAALMGHDDHIVRRTEEKKKILASLSHSISGRITILPIYGFGGIGKTTLAQMVYNDAEFKDYSRVWVYVSQTFDLNKIGNSLISQLSRNESKLTERQMINTSLVELLAGKNILVVFDDLWQDNGSQLDDLKHMLMAGADCKIVVIVTTRSEGIANMLQTIPPFKLAPLSNDSCWTIIKQKSGFDTRVDKQQLEQIGKDIAVKCGGVALAAQSLGHMLKHLTSDQWESVRKSNIWNVSASKDTDSVLSSLRLSYSYMPPYLKLCFAYCAIFPKGHKMVKDDLIHQWNSMGFIEGTDIFSTEQLGQNYIRQLLGLSFLEHSRSHNSMNRQWMYDADRRSPDFINGVHKFLNAAEANSTSGFICCPCKVCENKKDYLISKKVVHTHLLRSGFMPGYICWTKHGETGIFLEEGDEEADDNMPDFAQYGGYGDETVMGEAEEVAEDEDDDALGGMIREEEKDCESAKER